MRTLVVVTHPVPTSLTRAAFSRVLAGLARSGDELRVIDLDEESFNPCLTIDEKRRHLDPPETKPQIADHVAALRWAERIVLVYPTWFGGFPARLKGWFDRAWATSVAYQLPEGSTRVRAGLRNIRRVEVVTSHGSPRYMNMIQGNPGKLTIHRSVRFVCHPLCRIRFKAIYGLDDAEPSTIENWLDQVEDHYAG